MTEKKNQGEDDKLLAVDVRLSQASLKKGILNAVYPLMTDFSIILPQEGHPIQGPAACDRVRKTIAQDGWDGLLEWEPVMAQVSRAGDLGYTHGFFKRPAKDDKGETITVEGFYLTVWRKDAGGRWKIAVSQGLLLKKIPEQKPITIHPAVTKPDAVTKEIIDIENAFSTYSVKHGISRAFHRYIADNGIAIAGNGPPRLKGNYADDIAAQKENRKKMTLRQRSRPQPKLQWQPFYSFVSASGDMAYNYGPFTYTVVDADENVRRSYGHFVTVWKKQLDKTWKFMIDGGNSYRKSPR